MLNDVELMKHQKNVEGLSAALACRDDAPLRKAAADALGQIGGKRASQILASALVDPEESVRQAVIDALVKIGKADSAVLVEAVFKHPDEAVRKAGTDVVMRMMTQRGGTASRSQPAPKSGSKGPVAFFNAMTMALQGGETQYTLTGSQWIQILAIRLGVTVLGAVLWAASAAVIMAIAGSSKSVSSRDQNPIVMIIALIPFLVAGAFALRGWDWFSQYKFGTTGNFIKFLALMFLACTLIGMIPICYWTGKALIRWLVLRE